MKVFVVSFEARNGDDTGTVAVFKTYAEAEKKAEEYEKDCPFNEYFVTEAESYL